MPPLIDSNVYLDRSLAEKHCEQYRCELVEVVLDGLAWKLAAPVAPAPKPEQERPKFVFEVGDVVTHFPTEPSVKYLYRNGFCATLAKLQDAVSPKFESNNRMNLERDVSRAEIIAHLASLGFDAVFPDAPPQPVAEDQPSQLVPWDEITKWINHPEPAVVCAIFAICQRVKHLESQLAAIQSGSK